MKNEDKWVPTKYVYKKEKLCASSDSCIVGVGSRLITNLVASFYQDNINKYVSGRLLDLGCGSAPLYQVYRPLVSNVVCVDWANSNGEVIYADHLCDLNQPLPFDDGAFDSIIISDVMEHIFHPHQLWSEMNRVLSCNGKLLMSTPFFYCLHEIPNDFYRYTEYALRKHAENVSFKIIELNSLGGSPEIVTDIMCKHIQALPLCGREIAIVLQILVESFVKKTAIGRYLSKYTAQRFPLGYFLVARKDGLNLTG